MLAFVQYFQEICLLHFESDTQCKVDVDAMRLAAGCLAKLDPEVKIRIKAAKGDWFDRYVGLGAAVHNDSHLPATFDDLPSAPSLRHLAMLEVNIPPKEMAVQQMLLLNAFLIRIRMEHVFASYLLKSRAQFPMNKPMTSLRVTFDNAVS